MEQQPVAAIIPMLGILSQLFQSRTEALLEPSGLSYSQMAVLSHLSRHKAGQSISELASAFEIQQPGMSKLIQRLERSGAVATAQDPDDPRRKLVSISKTGKKDARAAGRAIEVDVPAWFQGWSDSEIVAFNESVGRLVGWLDENRLR